MSSIVKRLAIMHRKHLKYVGVFDGEEHFKSAYRYKRNVQFTRDQARIMSQTGKMLEPFQLCMVLSSDLKNSSSLLFYERNSLFVVFCCGKCSNYPKPLLRPRGIIFTLKF